MLKHKKLVSAILAVALLGAMSTSVFAQVKTTSTERYGTLRGELSTAIASTSVTKNPGDGVLSVLVKLVEPDGTTNGILDETTWAGEMEMSYPMAGAGGDGIIYAAYGTHGVTGISAAAVYTYTRV